MPLKVYDVFIDTNKESTQMPYKHTKKDVSLKLYPEEYVVLDIETTGLSPVQNEIIELSAIRVSFGKVKEEFSQLVKPRGFMSTFITELTGITPQMLETAPNIEEAILDFKNFCSDYILMGHNITFDLSFINEKLQKHHGMELENDYIDTLKLARKFLPQLQSKKLGIIAAHFNLNTDGMHRGLKDCTVTNLCYEKFLDILNPDKPKQGSLLENLF